jgi:hypothetical protein
MTDQIPQMQLVEAKAEPSVALMLQKVIDKGITKDNVTALESLVGLYDRMQAKNAEREFNSAFVKLQSEMPKIQADKMVTGSNGVVMYRYSSSEEIHDQARPYLIKNGFSIRSGQKMDGDRVTATATLMHVSGHSVSSDFTARSGKGAPGMNETKCDLSASTIAEREALCNLLDISRSSRQDDANMIGTPIGKALAEDLEKRVKAVGSDSETFLKFAGASKFEDISDEKWETLDSMLKRKEAAKAAREKLSPEGEWK